VVNLHSKQNTLKIANGLGKSNIQQHLLRPVSKMAVRVLGVMVKWFYGYFTFYGYYVYNDYYSNCRNNLGGGGCKKGVKYCFQHQQCWLRPVSRLHNVFKLVFNLIPASLDCITFNVPVYLGQLKGKHVFWCIFGVVVFRSLLPSKYSK
jgi:hypothetical protein